jgi:hypothetical protein
MASFKPIETYEVLRAQKCSISTIIEWHFEEVLKSINRKISLKWKYKDPFTCTVFRELHRDTFHQAFRAVRDYKITLGVKASITKNKKKTTTSYTLLFTRDGVARYYLRHLANKSKSFINELFSKTFACGSVGKIVITEKKPLEITYKCSTSTMQLKCHYNTVNSFGNLTSF